MPFSWMDNRPTPVRPGAFRTQFVRGIQGRARLLHNLKYKESDTVARIQSALRWEFDTDFATTPLPSFFNEVEDIVASVYAHGKQDKGVAKKRSKKSTRRKKK